MSSQPDASQPDDFKPETEVARDSTLPRVAGYQLLRKVGQGGMGVVYAAEQLRPRRVVAIKLMSVSLTSESARARFDREAEILGRLRHPNIATIIEAGTHQRDVLSIPFFVMEFIEKAASITEYAAANALTIEQRVGLLLAAASAIAHAHHENIYHHDLKPANMLVDRAGHVKIIDFGIAKIASESQDLRGDTVHSASLVLGTPQYMSPERFDVPHTQQIDGAASIPSALAAIDVYALGVVLYQLIGGQLPFPVTGITAESVATYCRRVLDSRPTSLRKLNPLTPPDLETVILKSISPEPAHRYESAEAFIRDLRAVLAGEPIQARRARIDQRVRSGMSRTIRRHPAISLLLAFALAVCTAERIGSTVNVRFAEFAFERFLMKSKWFNHSALISKFEHTRLLAMASDQEFLAIAKQLKMQGVDPTANHRAVRAIHGRLMEHLAASGCRPLAIAFDIDFPGPDSSFDDQFVRGANLLTAAGIPVVIAQGAWQQMPGKPFLTAKSITTNVIPAAATADTDSNDPWAMHAAVVRDHVKLGLATTAVAAAMFSLKPSDVLSATTDPNGLFVWKNDDVTKQLAVPITQYDDDFGLRTELGVKKGDVIAQSFIEIPSDTDVQHATVSYADTLNATPTQLRAWFDHKVIVIGVTHGDEDSHRYMDGRVLQGSVAQLVTIEQFISNHPIVRPRFVQFLGATLRVDVLADACISVVMLSVAWMFARGRLRLLVLTLFCGVLAFLSLQMFRLYGQVFSPVTPVLLSCAVCEVSAYIFRNSHRRVPRLPAFQE